MKHLYLCLLLVGCSASHLFSQNVGISADGSVPDPNAMLDIKASTKGLLIPRTSTSSRLLIPNTKGLLVYDSTTSSFWFNDGAIWNNLGGASSGWSLSGNSGTDATVNFLGTVDAQPLSVRVNNSLSGHLDNVFPYNSSWGYQSLLANTSGQANTGIGYQALTNNTAGYNNTATGASSLLHNLDGAYNTAYGANSLLINVSGSSNTAIGEKAMAGAITSSNCTAIGSGALYNDVIAEDNTAVGFQCLYTNNGVQAYANTAMGYQAMYSNTNGQYNTASGILALTANTTGLRNCAFGADAMMHNTTGGNNTAIGPSAMFASLSGSNNVAIGSNAGVGDGLTNAVAIGYNSFAGSSNTIQLGNNQTTAVFSSGSFITSDGRFKYNIKKDIKGLPFILKLVPVSYQLNVHRLNQFSGMVTRTSYTTPAESRAMHLRRNGFIAQDVEKAANETGFGFDGIYKPVNQKDHYSLNYSQFVVPLVKAVQELSAENDLLKQQLNDLLKRQAVLEKKVEAYFSNH